MKKSDLEKVLSEEKQIHNLLLQKIKLSEKKMVGLEALLQSQPDEIDDALKKEMYKNQSVQKTNIIRESSQTSSTPKKRMDKDTIFQILRFVGSQGTRIEDLFDYVTNEIGAITTRGNLRTLMNNFKHKKKWIDNPKIGFYKLTDLGTTQVLANKIENDLKESGNQATEHNLVSNINAVQPHGEING